MNAVSKQAPYKFTFTVKLISALQTLLGNADKKKVNKFIDAVRHSVITYHEHLQADRTTLSKKYEAYFSKLNDRSHQLARFITELNHLLDQAPPELFREMKRANRDVGTVHSSLVNLTLAVDKINTHKYDYYQDARNAVNDIYIAYCEVFDTKPNGRLYVDHRDIPHNAPIEDLLVPVIQLLILKDADQCYELLNKVLKK